MKTNHPFILPILLFLLFLLAACAQGTTELKAPEIRYGEDVCVDCNMIISDPRFATAYVYELSPGRYQSALFDDLGDMLIYADKNPTHKVVAWYIHDYETKEWADATAASYLVSNQVETPMASGIVSFASRYRAEAMAYSLGTEVMDWNTLQEKYRAGEIGVGMAGAAMTMGEQMHAAGSAELQGSMVGHEGMLAQEIVLGEVEVAGATLQLIAHEPLHTGYNAVMVHATGADGQPLDDLILEITPEMPTMGHGSPGNVNPTPQGNGHYLGTVNFTMAGPWTVTVVAKRGQSVLGETVFEFAVR